MNKRDFKSLIDINTQEFKRIIEQAIEYKELDKKHSIPRTYVNRTLAMIFKKNSTRTRVSFETAMYKLGGHAIFLSESSTQLNRGEDISDTARVLSGMVDLIMMRTNAHEEIKTLAENSSVPVINGLCNLFHPCQLLADMQTIAETKGNDFSKLTVAWIGDGNNMCNSYINASKLLSFKLKISVPNGYEPDRYTLDKFGQNVELCEIPGSAVDGADVVTTDVWASMGDEHENEERKKVFKSFQVNMNLMSKAREKAIFLHCLPAHRGEEIDDALIDSPYSAVWQQAHNRLYSTMALIDFLLSSNNS
ncbi:MAG: ornithine carbamoyltransferase [Pseudomonadota bacterium]|nr:ornithine carbamoyltransferase [Pseudomonadota bacterium]